MGRERSRRTRPIRVLLLLSTVVITGCGSSSMNPSSEAPEPGQSDAQAEEPQSNAQAEEPQSNAQAEEPQSNAQAEERQSDAQVYQRAVAFQQMYEQIHHVDKETAWCVQGATNATASEANLKAALDVDPRHTPLGDCTEP